MKFTKVLLLIGVFVYGHMASDMPQTQYCLLWDKLNKQEQTCQASAGDQNAMKETLGNHTETLGNRLDKQSNLTQELMNQINNKPNTAQFEMKIDNEIAAVTDVMKSGMVQQTNLIETLIEKINNLQNVTIQSNKDITCKLETQKLMLENQKLLDEVILLNNNNKLLNNTLVEAKQGYETEIQNLQNETQKMNESTQVRSVSSCADIYEFTTNSGVYTLTLADEKGNDVNVNVYCDMDTDGGKWTVFQKRHDGSVDFARPWDDYKNGFGQADGEYWLGNKWIHQMTSNGQNYELRVDVEAFDGVTGYTTYNTFRVAGESDNYRITVEGHNGPMADSFANKVNGKMFSTVDRDNDGYLGSCSTKYAGSTGFWFFSGCFSANLNGVYKSSGVSDWSGVVWYEFNRVESLKTAKMMFRQLKA